VSGEGRRKGRNDVNENEVDTEVARKNDIKRAIGKVTSLYFRQIM
jgi:hypothetical protein